MPNTAGETNIPISEWTTGTLKIYEDSETARVLSIVNLRIDYERQISDERDKRYQERWAAQEEAAKNLKEYQNEFRGSLNDLSTQMAKKDELAAGLRSVIEKIEAQEVVNREFRSRLDIGNPAIGNLQQQLATNQGITQGTNITKSDIYRAIGLGIGLLGFILSLIVLITNNKI